MCLYDKNQDGTSVPECDKYSKDLKFLLYGYTLQYQSQQFIVHYLCNTISGIHLFGPLQRDKDNKK
jgi:hypothetical protein